MKTTIFSPCNWKASFIYNYSIKFLPKYELWKERNLLEQNIQLFSDPKFESNPEHLWRLSWIVQQIKDSDVDNMEKICKTLHEKAIQFIETYCENTVKKIIELKIDNSGKSEVLIQQYLRYSKIIECIYCHLRYWVCWMLPLIELSINFLSEYFFKHSGMDLTYDLNLKKTTIPRNKEIFMIASDKRKFLMRYYELECAETLKGIVDLFPNSTPYFQTDMNTIYLDTIRTWMEYHSSNPNMDNSSFDRKFLTTMEEKTTFQVLIAAYAWNIVDLVELVCNEISVNPKLYNLCPENIIKIFNIANMQELEKERTKMKEIEESWHCSGCTYFNNGLATVCEMCGSEKNSNNPVNQNYQPPRNDFQEEKQPVLPQQSWNCNSCTFYNSADNVFCEMCGSQYEN